MTVVLLLVFLLVFAAIGTPLFAALGASCLSYLSIEAPQFFSMLPQKVWSGVYAEMLISMPLFMLAGELMNSGGITKRIINFCLQLVSPVKGGLGEVNVVASILFGGISGSSIADTAAIGSVLIPAMEKEGYPTGAACGITVASSTMGMIIPPSTNMIIFGMISGASVGALFIAGAIPGILIGVAQTILVYIISVRKGWHPKDAKFNGKVFVRAFLSGLPALLMPVFIVICVSFGITTASECAAAAVLYALIVGFFVYREMSFKAVWAALKRTFVSSASLMIIIGFSGIFTWIMTIMNVPRTVAELFVMWELPKIVVIIMFMVFILFIGTFIDVGPALLMLTPIMLPVMQLYGFSSLQFGAMMIVGLAIGLVTPPVGMCLNACNKITRVPITTIFKEALPYLCCNVLVLFGVCAIPALTTWLPQLLGYTL